MILLSLNFAPLVIDWKRGLPGLLMEVDITSMLGNRKTGIYAAIMPFLLVLVLSCVPKTSENSQGEISMRPSTGHFSGVSLSNLTDTPVLIQDSIFEASAEELPALGEGMKLEERDGKQMAHTQEGFFMEFEVVLPAGEYSFSIQAIAPNRSSDSYWVQVDGEQVERPLALPVGAVSERSIMLRLREPGKHKIRMELREAPGSAIGRIGLYRTSVNVVNPPMRQELRDRHPRIFFTSSDLDAMKARLNAPQVQRFYNPTGVLTRKPPAFRPGQRNGGSYRSLGSYAMSYLLEPDDEKLKGILEWLEMATTYPHCGVDLDAEYFMEGVALTYDWLYEYIPEELRIRVRDTIARQCREVYEVSLHGRTGGGFSFQQNHYWFAHLSMALGAAAIYGEMPETERWQTSVSHGIMPALHLHTTADKSMKQESVLLSLQRKSSAFLEVFGVVFVSELVDLGSRCAFLPPS